MARGQNALSQLGLSLAQTEAPGQLDLADSLGRPLGPDGRPGPGYKALGQGGDARLVLEHAGRRPHRLSGTGHPGQGHGVLMGQDRFDRSVQVRDR